jgi:conjugative transposon TraK protein
MFQSMKNIQSAFSYVKSFTLIIIVGCLSITFYAVMKTNQISQMSKQQMLVMDTSGNIQTASLTSRANNLEIEGMAHLKNFHHLFFSFDPERAIIQKNREQWSYLADESVVVQFGKMEEQGFFQNVVAGSISSRLDIEDIKIEKTDNPLYLQFGVKGKQRLIRSTSIAYRNLETSGRLRILENRTENNPHGFIIENWRIVDNSTISTETRYGRK